MDIVEYVVTVSNRRARACVVAAKRYARCEAVDRDDSSVGRVITLPPIISISPAISTARVRSGSHHSFYITASVFGCLNDFSIMNSFQRVYIVNMTHFHYTLKNY